jgi:hypothetical protein
VSQAQWIARWQRWSLQAGTEAPAAREEIESAIEVSLLLPAAETAVRSGAPRVVQAEAPLDPPAAEVLPALGAVAAVVAAAVAAVVAAEDGGN